MPGLFSRLKGGKDGSKAKSKKGGIADQPVDQLPPKPRWDDAFARQTVEPEEIQDLLRCCTEELKARALDHPFLLLPFRPTSDPSAVRTFIRHFFNADTPPRGDALSQDLRMTEPMVIAGVAKWCWSRLQGGVVGWDAYELFRVGELDSHLARDSFKTFIPLSVDNGARSCIIFDFFDLLAAIAAHGKRNGLGGRKLSRMAAWWAFEHKDTGSGFEGGYNAWARAADATSHLFFAYLRSLAPQQPQNSISMLPMSLAKLLDETEYPPQRPALMQSSTNKVVMIVDTVSPTPFALLRRANHFQYRDEDRALQEFSDFEDPIKALSDECSRVLKAISSANQSSNVSSAKHSTGLRDASWSRFEDIGFGSALEEDEVVEEQPQRRPQGLRTTPASGGLDFGRPTTPSWADFLSSGFVDEPQPSRSNHLLPPDKVLPPIETNIRQKSSQSHHPRLESDGNLEPGELASITRFDLDDAFWWVWMISLAPEETPDRKSAFGRCAVIETVIRSGRWIVMEEMVVGAAPEPQEGAYIAEKKGFFSWTRRNKGVNRRKSTGKQALGKGDKSLSAQQLDLSKTSIGPDQQAKVAAAAAQLHARQQREQEMQQLPERRGRHDPELLKDKTNSVLTLQPAVMKEASPAMKWANRYDKESIREAYLANSNAGRGVGVPTMQSNDSEAYLGSNGHANGHQKGPEVPPKEPEAQQQQPDAVDPAVPQESDVREEWPGPSVKDIEAPADVHPASRTHTQERTTPLPPPKESSDYGRQNMVSPEPNVSPDSKKPKKLHKENKMTGGGFKKLFGRRNRGSKLPENASSDLNSMLQQQQQQQQPQPAQEASQATPASELAPTPQVAPSPEPQVEPVMTDATPGETGENFVTPMEDPDRTPVQTPGKAPRSYQDDELSRVDSADANEAQEEFSRFDQGPLEDQPAFAPESDDDAAPPPIARHARPQEKPQGQPEEEAIPEVPEQPAKAEPSMQSQDRWAQIRKNAAERANQRQSEEQSRGGQSKTTDDGDDTSGEETIESRVARIKARVAELTGNMEGSSGPNQGQSPAHR